MDLVGKIFRQWRHRGFFVRNTCRFPTSTHGRRELYKLIGSIEQPKYFKIHIVSMRFAVEIALGLLFEVFGKSDFILAQAYRSSFRSLVREVSSNICRGRRRSQITHSRPVWIPTSLTSNIKLKVFQCNLLCKRSWHQNDNTSYSVPHSNADTTKKQKNVMILVKNQPLFPF